MGRAGRITSKDAATARKGAVHLAKEIYDMHFKGGTEMFILPEDPPSFQIKQQVENVVLIVAN